jgi:hypothetical protein
MNRHGYTFRKEKAIKVIEYDIEPKKKLANATMGLKRRDVLPNGALSKKAQRDVNMELDEGVEMSSASSDSDRGDDISEGEEDEDEDMDEEDGVQRVAKTASGQIKGVRGRNERVISAGEVRAHLRLLFMKEPQICALLYGRHGQPGGTNPLPLIRSIRAKAESTGETCQLCCPIRHFSRHQHRNQRNRCSTRLCQKAHLPRTRDPAQCRRDAPTSH